MLQTVLLSSPSGAEVICCDSTIFWCHFCLNNPNSAGQRKPFHSFPVTATQDWPLREPSSLGSPLWQCAPANPSKKLLGGQLQNSLHQSEVLLMFAWCLEELISPSRKKGCRNSNETHVLLSLKYIQFPLSMLPRSCLLFPGAPQVSV